MFDMPTTKAIGEFIAADLKEKLTVTEIQGGGGTEEDEEEEDEDSDSSSEEEERRRRRKKKKKDKKAKENRVRPAGSGGGGQPVEVYKGPPVEEILETVKSAALDLIGTETLEEDMPLMEAGLDSLAAVEFQSILTKQFTGVNLPA